MMQATSHGSESRTRRFSPNPSRRHNLPKRSARCWTTSLEHPRRQESGLALRSEFSSASFGARKRSERQERSHEAPANYDFSAPATPNLRRGAPRTYDSQAWSRSSDGAIPVAGPFPIAIASFSSWRAASHCYCSASCPLGCHHFISPTNPYGEP